MEMGRSEMKWLRQRAGGAEGGERQGWQGAAGGCWQLHSGVMWTGKVCQAYATPTADREAARHVRLWAPSLAPFACLLVPSLRG